MAPLDHDEYDTYTVSTVRKRAAYEYEFARLRSLYVSAVFLLLAGRSIPAADPALGLRSIAPGVAYVGSEVCAGCHKKLYDDYKRTAMGRSMALASHPSQLERVSTPVTIFNETLNRRFRVFRAGSSLYQSEDEIDTAGNVVSRTTYKLEYVIGSGVNGYGYVVREGDYLRQAPLSFYPKAGKWDLSPGYQTFDFGFTRPIPASCSSCHSGRSQPSPNRDGKYRDPPFLELAIGCENCHGPGWLHVSERVKGTATAGNLDTSIVNPAKLPARLADDICMYCHQDGDERLLQAGKNYSDFRPGTPLERILVITPRQEISELDLLNHHDSMMSSRCYRSSQGRLRCLTCHNPHAIPSASSAVSYYRSKCLGCHTETSCALSRRDRDPGNDCAFCHMPKRHISGISHASLTNHRIPAR